MTDNSSRLDGCVAIITGAAGGQGAAEARLAGAEHDQFRIDRQAVEVTGIKELGFIDLSTILGERNPGLVGVLVIGLAVGGEVDDPIGFGQLVQEFFTCSTFAGNSITIIRKEATDSINFRFVICQSIEGGLISGRQVAVERRGDG